MQHARVLVVLAVVLVPSATVGVAKDAQQLSRGDRVRVEVSTAEERLVGRLLVLDDKHLNLQVEGEDKPRIFPREDITALAVSGGRRSRGWGVLIGAGAGLALSVALGLDEWKNADDYPGWMAIAIHACFIVPIGAAIGLVVPPGERWENVLPEDIRVSIGPVRGGGAEASLTVGF